MGSGNPDSASPWQGEWGSLSIADDTLVPSGSRGNDKGTGASDTAFSEAPVPCEVFSTVNVVASCSTSGICSSRVEVFDPPSSTENAVL
ncbi:hypothetical protein GV64_11020 [Endozoicomonas elysicola]|uniref:Uncharacterized protein n=1 Tax=Endozoicomonas elysicola TaxID=305900 RepID=A0A081KAM6_9GAMM|nr:hypothetical protein GV64_11020 [Endozoicomonas elysicola]